MHLRRSVVLGLACAALATTPAQATYTSSVSGSSATMTGTAAGDALVIDASGGLLRHNRFTLGDPLFASDFDWHTGTAGDQTLVGSASTNIGVNASGGNDTLTVGSASAPAAAVDAFVSFDGGTETDAVVYANGTDTAPRNPTVTTSSIAVLVPAATVGYTNSESVSVSLGSGGDLAQIISAAAATPVSVDAGAGNDQVTVGGVSLANIAGSLTLSGGAGDDALAFSNSGAGDQRYVLEPGVARFNSGPAMAFDSTFDILGVTAGSGADAIFKRGPIPAEINAAGGDDSIVTQDAVSDETTCGTGIDYVYADALDVLEADCDASERPAAPTNTMTTVTNTVTTPGPATTVPGPTVLVPAPRPAADVAGPKLTVTVPRSIRRAALLRGLRVGVRTDEPSALEVTAIARPRSARLARAGDLAVATKSVPLGSGTRSVLLRPSRKLVGRARRFSLRLVITATDAARNRTVVTRTVRVR